jgi:hypothetical protein
MSDEPTLFPLTSSAAGSPAKTSASRDRVPVSLESVLDFGASSLESFASYDPDTSSWRTSQHSLLGGLETFSETWPRSGMVRGGTAYPLPPSAPLTDETGSLSWPTPNTIGYRSDGELRLLAIRCATREEYVAMSDRAAQSKRERWWPTPTVAMHKGSSARAMTRASGASRCNDRLDYAVEMGEIARGRLNPQWVEWLMGFPAEWTALNRSATPSSRKSRKSSAG